MTTADANQWDADRYDDSHSFVYEYSEDLVDTLDPGQGERVLDLGCGTGHLTHRIAARGADVIGIDAEAEMVEQARRGETDAEFRQADARSFELAEPVDAVFSNAALHWIPDADQNDAIAAIAGALEDGGRLVAEMGGAGNVASITDALRVELTDRGYPFEHPWYFPTIGEYASRLERHGFEVRHAKLFDRPTELDGESGLRTWIEMFGDSFFADVPDDDREEILVAVEDRLRESMFTGEYWSADYRRLRLRAVR